MKNSSIQSGREWRLTPHWPVLFAVALTSSLATTVRGQGTSAASRHLANAELASFRKVIKEATLELESDPSVDAFSRRGDARFFLGDFNGAATDYRNMVELRPSLDQSHWRLGIALFYAGNYDQAVAQFEKYHSFDDVDRENGIWRYFSQYKATDSQQARKELLRYEKDDREPFGDVYRLFAGKIEPAAVLAAIQEARIEKPERLKREFYAQLYVGLNAAIENRPAEAIKHLRKSTKNSWPKNAGYGPNYMWHVGRLQLGLLEKSTSPKKP